MEVKFIKSPTVTLYLRDGTVKRLERYEGGPGWLKYKQEGTVEGHQWTVIPSEQVDRIIEEMLHE